MAAWRIVDDDSAATLDCDFDCDAAPDVAWDDSETSVRIRDCDSSVDADASTGNENIVLEIGMAEFV